ncbi:hypothetical protein V8F20_001929 [Naviculisporaceae sp. PSN 640]
MSTKQPSRVVFVGNIPYGLTEEQIIEIFSGCGPVKNFRLVYDRDTGRPKGFGFCQYPDYDSAASAVRNLNDYEVMGRKLRVDFSNETVGDDDDKRDQHGGNAGNQTTNSYSQPSNGNANNPPAAGSSTLPPLPQGKDLPPGVTCSDAISRTLNALPPSQLLDILQQMKALATNDPARATELLHQAPQLSYAIFQALLLMGLVSPDAINSVLETGAPPPAAAAAAPVAAPPNPLAAAAYGGYPGGTAGTPPVAAGAAYAPPPAATAPVVPVPAPAPTPAPAAPPGQDPEALMRAVMELPQETIDQLPEAERQQIMALRASYGTQMRR